MKTISLEQTKKIRGGSILLVIGVTIVGAALGVVGWGAARASGRSS
ncbi:hypothetical protein ACE1BS_18340 [Aeromonas jandaei]